MKLSAIFFLAALLCGSAAYAAESPVGEPAASKAGIGVTIVVPPVFRVVQVTHAGAFKEYRIWTNMPSIVVGGTLYRFGSVGEHVIRLSAAQDIVVVHGL